MTETHVVRPPSIVPRRVFYVLGTWLVVTAGLSTYEVAGLTAVGLVPAALGSALTLGSFWLLMLAWARRRFTCGRSGGAWSRDWLLLCLLSSLYYTAALGALAYLAYGGSQAWTAFDLSVFLSLLALGVFPVVLVQSALVSGILLPFLLGVHRRACTTARATA